MPLSACTVAWVAAAHRFTSVIARTRRPERPKPRPNGLLEATDKAQWEQGIPSGFQRCRNTQIGSEIEDIPELYMQASVSLEMPVP